MKKDNFIRDEHGNIKYDWDGKIKYPEQKPFTQKSIMNFIEHRKNIGMELSSEEIKSLWESLSN